VKTAALCLGTAIVAAALGWLGTTVYWHLRIQGAIRTLDRRATPGETALADDVLVSAGCRSLPCLIDAIDPVREQPWLWKRIYDTASLASSTGPMDTIGDERTIPSLDLLQSLCDNPGNTPARRREQSARMHAWWKSDGFLFHHWWNVWSSRCGS